MPRQERIMPRLSLSDRQGKKLGGYALSQSATLHPLRENPSLCPSGDPIWSEEDRYRHGGSQPTGKKRRG